MLTIYDVLYEKGYDGDYPLTDYYKNYYHTDDLSTVFGNLSMESVGNNGTFDLSGTIDEVAAKYDGTYPYFDFANIFTSKSKLKARLYEVEPAFLFFLPACNLRTGGGEIAQWKMLK